jgi:hypothetical protein
MFRLSACCWRYTLILRSNIFCAATRKGALVREHWHAILYLPWVMLKSERRALSRAGRDAELRAHLSPGSGRMRVRDLRGRVPFIKKVTPRAPTKPITRRPARLTRL